MTTPLSATVANLRRLLDDATPGPWAWEPSSVDDASHRLVAEIGLRDIVSLGPRREPDRDADADLVVSAVNALPELLDGIERLEKVAREARDFVELMLRGGGSDETYYMSRDCLLAALAALTEVDPHA